MKKTIICLLFSLLVSHSFAATFTVDRQGNGDFLVIQDAVDAAASGDTILIGPGRYNEGQIVETGGWTDFVRVLVHQEELTLIGSGSEDTIIGPDYPYVQGDDQHKGIVAGPYFGCDSIRVENIGFENMYYGFHGHNAPGNVVAQNCRFDSNYYSLRCSNGNFLEVNNCIFNLTVEQGGPLLYGSGLSHVNIIDSNFTLTENSIYNQTAVGFQGCFNVDVNGCNFYEGSRGLKLVWGNEGVFQQVRGCNFVGQSALGLIVNDASANVEDSIFSQQSTGILTMGLSNLIMTNSAITDAGRMSIDIFGARSMEVTNCILAHGSEYTIKETSDCGKASSDGLPVLNLTNNDWGTDDEATIASWIHLCDFEADFIPFEGGLSSAEIPEPLSQLSVHPNPFNPRTTISFSIDKAQNVELSIFDMTGKRIAMLADHVFQAGVHSMDWPGLDSQGRAVASGTYLLRMVTDENVVSEKMMLLR